MANDLEKECIQFTEDILKGYRELRLHLDRLNRHKNNLKCEFTTKGISYDREKVSSTNKISKEVEDGVIKTITKIEDLEKEIEEESSLIKEIDIVINNLSPIQREIIEYKYIEKLSWNEIIDKTCYSERSLRNKKNEAVRCIAIALFGLNVFKEKQPSLFEFVGK